MSPWIRLAFLALGAAVLVLLIAGTDVHELQEAVRRADITLLAGAVVLLATDVGLKAVRWRFMAAQLAEPPLSLVQAAAAVVAGVAAASLTPARGVELAKPLLLRRSRGVAVSTSTAAVIVERLLDGVGMIVLFGISVALVPAGRAAVFRPVFAVIGIFVVGVGLVLAVPSRLSAVLTRVISALPLPASVRPRALSLVQQLLRGMLMWRRHEQLWIVVALSIVATVVEAFRLSLVCAALGVPITVVQAMFTFSLANLVAVLTLIPGGVGVTELSMAGIIRLITAAGSSAALTAAVLVDRILSYYLVIVVGSLVLLAVGVARPHDPGTGAQDR